MNINENVAYLRGLAEGMNLDTATNEGKLFNAIIEILDEMATEIAENHEYIDDVAELADELDEDLGDIEEYIYDDDDDDDYDCCCEDDDDDCDCCCDEDEDNPLYEVDCPKCGDTIYLDEDMLLSGDTECPNCGAKLEFDLGGVECDCEDGCDCGCESDCDCEE